MTVGVLLLVRGALGTSVAVPLGMRRATAVHRAPGRPVPHPEVFPATRGASRPCIHPSPRRRRPGERCNYASKHSIVQRQH